jgi:hypothetical protein
MKKILFGLCLVFLSTMAFSQQGLDGTGIVVERYYIANAADHAIDANLAVGAVTYRIYVDMKAGWQLQTVTADPDNSRELMFSTTAPRFYNAPGGSAYGSNINYANLASGTLMLDSWISMGAASASNGANYYYGIPKLDDDAVNQIVHSDGALQNATGYPTPYVNQRDGYITVASPATVSITPNAIAALESMLNGTGNSFSSTDCSWFTTGSCTGPNADNKVLIAQFTTEGTFSFKMNINIRNISSALVESYVCENDNGMPNTFLLPALAQTLTPPALPTPPTVTGLNASPNTLIVGETVSLSVTATDAAPGSISSVEFFRAVGAGTPVSLGVSASTANPYTLNWVSSTTGTFNITARATDNDGTQTTSLPVTITVNNAPANQPPVVNTLTAPSSVLLNAPVNVVANATDPNGTVASVAFSVNGGTPTVVTGPGTVFNYSFNAPATEQTLTIKAVATDNMGATSADKFTTVVVTDPAGPPYQITSQNVTCNSTDFFYVPVVTRTGAAALANITGFDMVMTYDPAVVVPTGVIRVNNDLITDSLWTSYAMNIKDTSINISLFLNSSAPENTFFHGNGQVLAVEFAKTVAFNSNDTAEFEVPEFVESYNNTTTSRLVRKGSYITYSEHLFTGSLKFWLDNSPIGYTGNANTALITNIYGSVTCPNPAGPAVNPDLNGIFVYDIVNGSHIVIQRDINPDTSVMAVINGFDAYLVQKVLVEDASFTPNVFQIIAMDVNKDLKISAGDLSQINQRTVGINDEFKQAWNYNPNGTKISGTGPSYDWVFIDNKTYLLDIHFRKSNSFPKDDGFGFSKNRVPNVAPCLTLPVENYSSCPIIQSEEYIGILLGDVNGNYKNVIPLSRPGLKSTKGLSASDKVLFDMSNAKVNNGYLEVPISVSSENSVNSLDFAMKFDLSKLSFKSVIDQTNYLQSLAYYKMEDQTLRFTSYSLQSYAIDAPVLSLRFELKDGAVSTDDIYSISAYVNGDQAAVELTEMVPTGISEINFKEIKIYPNPASEVVNVELSENANLQLLDMNGRIILTESDVIANQKHEISIAGLAEGMYMLKIYNDEFVTMKKVIVKK